MPLMVTVTVLPAARSVLVPEITRFCACSITLMTSSPATVSMRRPGNWASMVTSREDDPVLPCAFVTLAETVRSPLPSAVN